MRGATPGKPAVLTRQETQRISLLFPCQQGNLWERIASEPISSEIMPPKSTPYNTSRTILRTPRQGNFGQSLTPQKPETAQSPHDRKPAVDHQLPGQSRLTTITATRPFANSIFCDFIINLEDCHPGRSPPRTSADAVSRVAYAFSSRLTSFKKRQSVPLAMIFCGLLLIMPSSCSRSA